MKTTIEQRQISSPGVWPAKAAVPAQRIPVTGKLMREEKVAITFAPVKKAKAKSKVSAAAKRARTKARS